MKRKIGVWLSFAAIHTGSLLFGASTVATGSEGEGLAWKYHCVTCHGVNGKSTQSRYPNIAGQNALYIESRLKYFRGGSEPANRMNGQAAPLSDEEISILSQHFSRMPR